jgi:hypothetical protein
MTVAAVSGQIDLLATARASSVGTTARGTWVAVGAAVALLLGRALVWLLVQLLKFLVLLAIVGAILAIGFELGSHWDSLTGAAPAAVESTPAGPTHQE